MATVELTWNSLTINIRRRETPLFNCSLRCFQNLGIVHSFCHICYNALFINYNVEDYGAISSKRITDYVWVINLNLFD